LRDDAIERQREHPHQVADAMRIEHLSLALNPRATLYKGRSLIQITVEAGNDVAVQAYRKNIESEEWALYRVRRTYSGKGKADRAVEKLDVFENPAKARTALNALSARSGVAVEELRGILYVWRERRSETDFPTREEFLTVAPATVETKARYGLDWFEVRWSALQLRLFFDRSGDRSITPHPEARGGTRWNAGVEYSILKCPDRLAPNDVSGFRTV
jgi:hypothetical protein